MDNGLWTEKFSDEPITGKVYGISIGVGVAITFGVALDNIAIGISIGLGAAVSLGVGFSLLLSKRKSC